MPTIPEKAPHGQRRLAESFGADAERYDRARPRYPASLVARIAATGPRVLDVGCGTGIAARQFGAAGCEVLGVDPDARMAALARRLGTEVEVAAFEAWDPAGREFDAVVAGQAWHWVDPVAGAAKAARVLRPGGRLALFWNVPQLPPALTEAFADAYERAVPDAPFAMRTAPPRALDGYEPLFARAADGIREAGGFGAPERWCDHWEWTYTRDAWLDQLPTQGSLTRVPPEKRSGILEAVGAAIDARGGRFTASYTTVTLTARDSTVTLTERSRP
ncbi:SAM-dependent methyltransferase [Streptomyces sp. WAC 01529]|uniref:class I SAM-dependent methyltransferase n=1 Tax=Streptomyces sp. WAC 01529 TaxID=2203205 RepID=UPI000F6F25CF|nr:class I SAM-dependent methyltransferase [Streptomyces sp. WAC 01529]AZM56088.1 SAM-dependent methyltransferase [Streptomyces sp. WAC 01529]